MKKYILSHIDENELEIIEIDTKFEQINYINSHEFYYNNKLYDIVRLTKNNSILKIVAVHDANEQTLVNNYISDFKDKFNEKSKELNRFLNSIFSSLEPSFFENFRIEIFLKIRKIAIFTLIQKELIGFSSLNLPPPKF